MPSKRERIKGRKEKGSFAAFPHDCLNHENFHALSAYAVKLLVDIYSQYKGNNNGDLCLTWSMMKKRGWRSESTLNRARRELIQYGWIALTRQGGRNQPSLYCVTWQPIDQCGSKLDVKPTITSLGTWKTTKSVFEDSKINSSTSDTVVTYYGNRSNKYKKASNFS